MVRQLAGRADRDDGLYATTAVPGDVHAPGSDSEAQHKGGVSERLLTAAEVAERLSVPESWVRQETRAGRIPHVPLGRYKRYEWPAIVEWLGDQRAGQWRKHRPLVSPSPRS